MRQLSRQYDHVSSPIHCHSAVLHYQKIRCGNSILILCFFAGHTVEVLVRCHIAVVALSRAQLWPNMVRIYEAPRVYICIGKVLPIS